MTAAGTTIVPTRASPMARWLVVIVCLSLPLLTGCRKQRDMPERVEMPDTMTIMRAMQEAGARDSMLDTIPGGEMARGDSAASMQLLKDKM